jgi:hypothetical protein
MDARFYEVKRCMFCSGREAKKEMPAKLAGTLLTNTISLGIESPEKFCQLNRSMQHPLVD